MDFCEHRADTIIAEFDDARAEKKTHEASTKKMATAMCFRLVVYNMRRPLFKWKKNGFILNSNTL